MANLGTGRPGLAAGRPSSRLSSVADSVYYDAATPRGSIDGGRETDGESQYFSDEQSNFPNGCTASLGAYTPMAPPQPPNDNVVGTDANRREDEEEELDDGQRTPRAASIDEATRQAYAEDPIEEAEQASTAQKLDTAEAAAGIVNRQTATQEPMNNVAKEDATVPSQMEQSATTEIRQGDQELQVPAENSPVKISSSASSNTAFVPGEKSAEKRESTSVDMGEKGEKDGKKGKKKGKKGKEVKEKDKNPEDDPDLAHLDHRQKRILLDQIDMDQKGKSISYLAIYRFSSKYELLLDAIGILAAIASGIVQPLMTVIFGNLTTAFTNFGAALASGQDTTAARDALNSEVAKDALYLVYIGIGMLATTYIYMYSWIYSGEMTTRRIREAYLRSVLRQNVAFFDKIGAGEVTTRITSDMHLIQEGISEKIPITFQFIAQFTGFIVAYVKNWRMALVLSSIIPAIAVSGGIMASSQGAYRNKMLAFVAEGGTLAEEVISSIRVTHAFGTQRKLAALYDVPNKKAFGYGRKTAILTAFGLFALFFIIYGAYGLAFYWGSILIATGRGASGEIVTCIFAILIGAFSLSQIAPQLQAVGYSIGAAQKVLSTVRRVPPIDSSSDTGSRPNLKGDIVLRDVDFYYPLRPSVHVLKRFNATFRQNETTAMVGASGSGKSSVIALLMRFYNVLGGDIEIAGTQIEKIHIKYLRSQIGYVQQEPTLFSGTVWENVAHGLINTDKEHLSEDEKRKLVKTACELANADSFIQNLPGGYDCQVGERAMLLSGGQSQRISIARAVVSDPPILLLDEATSALDTTSEVLVQAALDRASFGRTTITIAHRLSTIKNADQIIVMSKGDIVEQGTHNELLDRAGAYAALVEAQQLKEEETEDATPNTVNPVEVKALEEAEAKERATLKRTGTGRSETSQILERQKQEADSKKPKEHGVSYLLVRMIGEIWSETKWYYVIGTLLSIMLGMVYPVFAIIFGGFLGTFNSTDPEVVRSGGRTFGLYMFIVALVASAGIWVQTYAFGYTSEFLAQKLRFGLFSSIMRQDISYFDKDENSTGKLTSEISEKPQKVNAACGITLGVIIQNIFTLVGGIIVGLCYSWKLALVGTACVPLTLSAGIVRLRVVNLKDEKTRKAHGNSAQVACEAAAAIRTVASLTREDDACEKYSRSLDLPMKVANQIALYSNFFFSLTQALSFPIIALIFWYGSNLLADGEISTGQFFVTLTAVIFGSIQAGNIFTFVPDVSSAKGAAAAIVKLLDADVEIDAESTEGAPLQNAVGHVTFKNVHFRYPSRPGVRVLRGLNLEVKPGQFIALVGPSGCGKSTIIQLMERFYDPISGDIEIDGQNLASLNVSSLRESISLVSQQPTLYDGSIRFNIMLGAAGDVTDADLERACKDANIHDFIVGLPDGYDTLVGGKGTQLSGGQRQRVAIARALIRHPKVLLLDEATSALDSQSEKVVQAALDAAASGRTTVAVAHRLSTIQNADVIYVLKDGRVAERGTHQELLRAHGIYAELVTQQALDKAP